MLTIGATEDLRIALGKEIKKARIDNDLSQGTVARAADISLGYLSQIERGREASTQVLRAIADAFGRKLSELFTAAAVATGDQRFHTLAEIGRLLEEMDDAPPSRTQAVREPRGAAEPIRMARQLEPEARQSIQRIGDTTMTRRGRVVHRSSVSGKFVKKGYAKKHSRTTEREVVRKGKRR